MRGRVAVSIAAVLLGWGALSQRAPAETAAELAPVVVTATRVAESSADLPVSIDRVGRRAIADGQLQVNLSESLITVPGVSVQSRQNYAQDLQLSVRGFGARSSFGVGACGCTRMAFPAPCRTARVSFRNSIWAPPITSKCCAGRSRRCTATPRAVSSRSSPRMRSPAISSRGRRSTVPSTLSATP